DAPPGMAKLILTAMGLQEPWDTELFNAALHDSTVGRVVSALNTLAMLALPAAVVSYSRFRLAGWKWTDPDFPPRPSRAMGHGMEALAWSLLSLAVLDGIPQLSSVGIQYAVGTQCLLLLSLMVVWLAVLRRFWWGRPVRVDRRLALLLMLALIILILNFDAL